ncbi:hypothetical protein [Azonexus hydrophilus]|uniref:Uncharacterized protein n=1 Tax=Azonexus hydrophilus TaxID=418702 RepID=A0ABZ2XM50_9RHOO
MFGWLFKLIGFLVVFNWFFFLGGMEMLGASEFVRQIADAVQTLLAAL